jgi:hypothetical protein
VEAPEGSRILWRSATFDSSCGEGFGYRSADIFSRRRAALEEREKAADAEKDRLDLGALAEGYSAAVSRP